jgi:hypothetical protein
MHIPAFGTQTSITRHGLYVYWRLRGNTFTRGFIIKLKSAKLFSERYGYTKGRDIGPLYFRCVERPSPDPEP